ncbi:hypothetical protein WR25_02863 [Diploscapter pachys]|uniref:Phosphatidylinositol 3-kinase n=1 Tax=Diploscapter pachys TaxID=2018661 RepID=A0A2A2KQG1_9BILA|nr:hypothetical protein WR25_02863 [Diploscapter pachys]
MSLQQFQQEADKVDQALEAIHKKAIEAKKTIEELILMLNREDKVHWPDMLEKYSSLAALMSQLQIALRRNALPSGEENSGQLLRSNVFVPLRLQLEPDPRLEEMTQGRVVAWHHDVVPDYLRTKLNPEIETEEAYIENERNSKGQDYIIKQVVNLNKHVDLLLTNFATYDRAQTDTAIEKPAYSDAETQRLVRAIMCGEDLRQVRAPSAMLPQQLGAGTAVQPQPGQMGMAPGMAARGTGPGSVAMPQNRPQTPVTSTCQNSDSLTESVNLNLALRIQKRRTSQMLCHNPKLQSVIDKINGTSMKFHNPALKSLVSESGELFNELILRPDDPGSDHMLIAFPWFVAPIRCSFSNMTLRFVKEKLFENLRRMARKPFSWDPRDYIFYANQWQYDRWMWFYNEDMTISETGISTNMPMMLLKNPADLEAERNLEKSIGRAIGYPLEKLETTLNESLKAFRAELFTHVDKTVKERGNDGREHYAFPEENILDFETKDFCPHSLVQKIDKTHLIYRIYYRSEEDERNNIDDENKMKCMDVKFKQDYTPVSLIQTALHKLLSNKMITKEEADDAYLLQLVGKKSFLTSEKHKIVTYESVRSSFENYRHPKFILRRQSILYKDYRPPKPMHTPYYVHAHKDYLARERNLAAKHALGQPQSTMDSDANLPPNTLSLWEIDDNLHMKPISCSNVIGGMESDLQMYVRFSVYCGKALVAKKESNSTPKCKPSWSEHPFINLDLYLSDMPSLAVLNVQLMESKTKKGKKEETCIGWVNLCLRNWDDSLLQGRFTLFLRSGPVEFPPNGPICHNEKKGDATNPVSRLIIELPHYGRKIYFPSMSLYRKFVAGSQNGQMAHLQRPPKYKPNDPNPPSNHHELVKLREIYNKVKLGTKLSNTDEELVFDWRYYVQKHIPELILVLVECDLMWKLRDHFAHFYIMLEDWPKLSLGTMLTLLNKRYLDVHVRQLAVRHLDAHLDHRSFPLFLLPLVQAIKCEPWPNSELVNLLLKKALMDYRIGHKLFWLMRAELANQMEDNRLTNLFKRLAIFIEAYLRGNEDHISTVVKQVEMLNKLTELSVYVKNYKEKDTATKKFQQKLQECHEKLENMESPLDPTHLLGPLRIEKCRVLGSAKMPLKLYWRNTNPLSAHYLPTYEIIFKNGDDLRQDMLVIQVLEVMDSIWKVHQIDCCLSTYPILPMGSNVGLIGCVSNCATIFEIQSEGGKMGTAVKSLDTKFLNQYLREHSKDNAKEYMEAADRFNMSCVGYSVATFIMGIKDRHNDNIMLTKDGKLFHIDFGHILGHGKTKLGIQRDRVPFVLTEHFLTVISKGNDVSMSKHEISKFKEQCIKAYIVLWRERHQFVSLFSLMYTMGLPEFSCEEDLEHLKKTIGMKLLTEEEAKKYFMSVFEEAFNGSWATKTNWFFHTVKHL